MLKRLKPPQEFALLGALSGALTTLVRWEAFVIRDTSVLPGIFFGLVLAFALYRWEKRSPLPLIGVVLGVVIAWVAAWNSAVLLHDYFSKTLRFGGPLTFTALGLIAGFIGSAITAAAVYLFSRAFRDRPYWVRVVLFGTLAGALLALPELGLGSGTLALLPLFVLWQAGVASMIVRGITGLR